MSEALARTLPTTRDAGDFASWLSQMRGLLQGEAGGKVPCGDCVGCCVSSYPVPLRAHESASLAAIPIEHVVTARTGQTMIVALADGRCPMLSANRCSIYELRPQTCRDYDCRIFAAAGIQAGGDDRSAINERVRQWRFSYSTAADRSAHEAVRSAATFIRQQRDSFPGKAPTAPTGIAVLAIKSYEVFLDNHPQARTHSEVAKAIIAASRAFDSASKLQTA